MMDLVSKNPRFTGTVSQQGFSLVTTLFIIVFLMVLGANMVKVGTSQQQTISLSLKANRAYYAALSGLEYCENEVVSNVAGGCPASCPSTPATNAFNIEGYNVDISCTAYPFKEADTQGEIFKIEATAQHGSFGELEYVSRKLSAVIQKNG